MRGRDDSSGDARSALSKYLDELLHPAQEAAGSDSKSSASGLPGEDADVEVAAGRIEPADERYYVCSLAGLAVALPAVRISGEQETPEALAGTVGDLVWFVDPGPGQRRPVVDLACLVLADGTPAERPAPAVGEGILILLDGGSWSLWAPRRGELEAIDCEAVRWRGPSSVRRWMAGTLAARRLVLLDLDHIAGMIR